MNWVISSYSGVGPLQFGLTRDNVRAILGTPWEAFKRTPSDLTETDAFFGSTLFVYYDAGYLCEAVELASPLSPMIDGFTLIQKPFSEVLAWVKERDGDVILKRAGLTSPKCGIRVYAPSCSKNLEDPVQSITVFKKGYGQTKG